MSNEREGMSNKIEFVLTFLAAAIIDQKGSFKVSAESGGRATQRMREEKCMVEIKYDEEEQRYVGKFAGW